MALRQNKYVKNGLIHMRQKLQNSIGFCRFIFRAFIIGGPLRLTGHVDEDGDEEWCEPFDGVFFPFSYSF